MKSIVEEASSIIKAIEKGWASAGNPKEFTIKVFEEPQKNFIGITTKPAKIAIFFSETAAQKAQEPQKRRRGQEERQKAAEIAREPKMRGQRPAAPQLKEPQRKERPQPTERIRTESASAEREHQGPIWSDDMITLIQGWLNEMLPLMGLTGGHFTINPQHFHLKIQFDKHVLADESKEKYLFASLAHLLLTMLKRHYRRPLKGYKIVLTGS